MILFSNSPVDIPPVRDIYYHPTYGQSAQRIDSGTWECAYDPTTYISYSYIRREVSDGSGSYDTITPYGYGGLSTPPSSDPAAHRRFRQRYLATARERGLIAELTRLNPLDNVRPFLETADRIRHHTTYGSIVEDIDDEFRRVSGKHRTSVRKAHSLGVTVIEDDVDQLVSPKHPFREMYSATMQRLGARSALRFDNDYFAKLTLLPQGSVQLLLASIDSAVVAGAIFFVWHDRIHYHLSCASHVGRQASATNALIEHAKRTLAQPPYTIHLGGGLGDSDSLAKFKSRCSSSTLQMVITETVVQPDAYRRLSSTYPETSFFPAYRAARNMHET